MEKVIDNQELSIELKTIGIGQIIKYYDAGIKRSIWNIVVVKLHNK